MAGPKNLRQKDPVLVRDLKKPSFSCVIGNTVAQLLHFPASALKLFIETLIAGSKPRLDPGEHVPGPSRRNGYAENRGQGEG